MLTRRLRLADFSPVSAECEEVAGLRFRFLGLFSEVGEFDALNLASYSKCSSAASKTPLQRGGGGFCIVEAEKARFGKKMGSACHTIKAHAPLYSTLWLVLPNGR